MDKQMVPSATIAIREINMTSQRFDSHANDEV
jgi:hypothetical protein